MSPDEVPVSEDHRRVRVSQPMERDAPHLVRRELLLEPSGGGAWVERLPIGVREHEAVRRPSPARLWVACHFGPLPRAAGASSDPHSSSDGCGSQLKASSGMTHDLSTRPVRPPVRTSTKSSGGCRELQLHRTNG